MRKLSPYLSLITIILVGVGAFVMPNPAHAGVADTVLTWVTGGTDFVYGIFGKILWWVLVPVTGWVVWLTGAMIDQIITISSDANFYNSDAIKNSWSILRDIANMTFIFILIYNGLKVILNQGNLATIKKVLGGVILAAIFINFSLFFTKAVIDVSNITAAWFVQGIHGIGGTTSVSDAVMGTLQMSKLAESPVGKGGNFSAQSFATGIAVIALNCVAAYVFFQVFFLLLGRLVAFLVLLVTAPIGFVGFLLPQLEEYGSKWWKELQGQAMLAPVFFLMLYIGLYIIDQTDKFVFGSSASADPYTGSSFSAANYVMFAVIIALLLKILDVSKKYSGEMGGKIGGLLKSGIGIALGGATAAVGLVGRQTAGKALFNITQDDKKMASLRAGASTSMFGRIKLAAVNKGATSSFDARATTLGSKALGGLGTKIAGVPLDAGKVGKTEGGGFKAGAEAFAKKEKEWAEKNLGKGPAGEINRMQYASSMQKGTLLTNINKLTNLGVGKVAYKDAYKDIEKAARDNFRKKAVEDSKKATKDISNKIVDEQMAVYQIGEAIKSNDNDQINATLEAERSRIGKIWSDMEKDAIENKKAAHLEYNIRNIEERLKEPGAGFTPEGQVAMNAKDDFEKKLNELKATMTEDEKKKATQDAEKLLAYTNYKSEQDLAIHKAIGETDTLAKKNGAKEVSENIINKKIGKKSEQKMPNGKTKKVAPEGTLNWELDKKKEDLKEAQEELDAIEGKKEEKKDEKKEEGKKDSGDEEGKKK